jgi:hypothetical protein
MIFGTGFVPGSLFINTSIAGRLAMRLQLPDAITQKRGPVKRGLSLLSKSLRLVVGASSVVLVLVGLAVLTGPGPSPIGMVHLAGTFTDLGAVKTQRVYKAVGLQIDVPDPSAVTAVPLSASQALAKCEATGCHVWQGDAQAELAVVTDSMWRQAGVLQLQHVLAYVISWPNQPCTIYGAVNMPSPPVVWRCDRMTLIDANTGGYIEAVETPQ